MTTENTTRFAGPSTSQLIQLSRPRLYLHSATPKRWLTTEHSRAFRLDRTARLSSGRLVAQWQSSRLRRAQLAAAYGRSAAMVTTSLAMRSSAAIAAQFCGRHNEKDNHQCSCGQSIETYRAELIEATKLSTAGGPDPSPSSCLK